MKILEEIKKVFPLIKEASTETYIKEIKKTYYQKFLDEGFPNSKEEEWRFSYIEKFLPDDLNINKDKILIDKIYMWKSIIDIDCYKLVFIDGIFQNLFSEKTINGCKINFSETENYFTKSIYSQDKFLNLNLAISTDGFSLKIEDNQIIDKPIYILNISTGENLISTHNIIVAGKNSNVKIIEENITKADSTFYNNLTEIFVSENANYTHYKIQNDDNVSCVDNTFIIQDKFSNSTINTISLKGKFIRNNPNIILDGQEATGNLNGLTFIDKDSLIDNHTFIYHKSPNCNSNEIYKGIFKDGSKGIFNGKVLVHKDAQKTNGYQSNNNILLSDKATINTKPQLEIFADDVKCSHGCTIGQLDKESLFYLRARGIPKKEATNLLISAFLFEITEKIDLPQVKDFLESKLNTI